MPDPHEQRPKSDFIAAEEIKGILHGREKSEQERIIRWVSESLSLAAVPARTTGQGPPPLISPPAHSGPPHGGHAGERIKAFVEEKKPKSDIQFAAVVAYFHRFEASGPEQKDAITADDLREATRLAGWSRFKTPSVPLNNAVKQGYLDRAERGAFKVNAVGENLVAMTLPGAGGDSNGPRPARRKASKKRTKKRPQKKKAP
jgi:hypothetical protein